SRTTRARGREHPAGAGGCVPVGSNSEDIAGNPGLARSTPLDVGSIPCDSTFIRSAAARLLAPAALCHRSLGRANQADQEMPEVPELMRGKRGLIMGVANHRSLAWGIAKACHAHGAALAFTYQGDALKKRVEPLARDVGGILVGDCDVT